MISAGFETTDPITQTRTVVIQGDHEMSGRGWVLEVHCPQRDARFLSHVHRTWTETFEIIQGSAACTVNGAEHRLAQGERIVMAPGVPHVHPWNVGTDVMIYRQTNDFGAPAPGLVSEIIGTFATIHGLAREGRVGRKGLPSNPFQLIATGSMYGKHGTFDAGMPIALQVGLYATVGRLAGALGYRAVYDRFLR